MDPKDHLIVTPAQPGHTESTDSLRDLAHLVIIILGLGYLAFIGRTVLLSLLFAALFAILLYPIYRRIAKWISIKWLAVLLSMILATTPREFSRLFDLPVQAQA